MVVVNGVERIKAFLKICEKIREISITDRPWKAGYGEEMKVRDALAKRIVQDREIWRTPERNPAQSTISDLLMELGTLDLVVAEMYEEAVEKLE